MKGIGWHRALAAIALAAMFLSGVSALALPGAAGELGTVDTIAGPGFCQSTSSLDPSSSTVRALAVTRAGSVFVDTGPLRDGVVAQLRDSDPFHLTDAAVAVEPHGSESQAGAVRAPSRLAADGRAGAIASVGDRVVNVVGRASVAGLAWSPGRTRQSSGDDGPAQQATFHSIMSIATDPAGNLYIADSIDPVKATFRIRFVNRGAGAVTLYGGTPQEVVVPPGVIVTIAGAPPQSPVSDGHGLASSTPLQGHPPAMAATGDLLYVAVSNDTSDNQRPSSSIGVINTGNGSQSVHGVELTPGSVATIAGGAAGFSGDGGPARGATFGYLPGIAASADGTLYLADEQHHRVRRIDRTGVITTFAGSGGTGLSEGGYDGNRRPAIQARLNRPFDVKIGTDERIYISDSENGQVRYVDAAGIIHGLPRGLAPVSSCRDEQPTVGGIRHVTADASGTAYLTGDVLAQVKRADGDGAVTNVAGVPMHTRQGSCPPWPPGCPTTDDRPATEVPLDRPTSLAAAPGGFYVFGSGHRAVRFLNTSPHTLKVHGVSVKSGRLKTVVAGKRNAMARRVPGPASELPETSSLSADRLGNLFVADTDNHTVWVVDRRGRTTSLFPPPSSPEACCREAVAVAATADGNLYVLDRSSNRIWFLNRGKSPATVHGQDAAVGALVPVVGSGAVGAGGEGGPALLTQLLHPVALAVGNNDDLFIADDEDNTIRRVDRTGTIATVAGAGPVINAYNGDGNQALLTRFDRPAGIAVDPCGSLLVADYGNDRLRRVNLAPPCSPPPEDLGGPQRGLPPFLIPAVVLAALIPALALASRRSRWRDALPHSPRP